MPAKRTLLPVNETASAVFAAGNLNPIAELEPTQYILAIEDPSDPADVRFLHVLQGANAGAAMVSAAVYLQNTTGNAFDGAAFASFAVSFPFNAGGAFGGTTLPTRQRRSSDRRFLDFGRLRASLDSFAMRRKDAAMDVGLFSELQCPPAKPVAEAYRDAVAEGELADQLGFRSLWLAELHFTRDFSVMPAPQMVAAAIAARTRRLRLGIGVHILPVHHPLRLAEEGAALDLLSNGRYDFGAGRGHPFTRVYEGFGVPEAESRQRFDECLAIVRRAWTEPSFSYRGKFFSFEDVDVVPKPLQKPHPPIHIGAVSPTSAASAGDGGYNVICPAHVTPLPAIKELLATYREQLGRSSPGAATRVALLMPLFVAKTRAQAESIPRASIMSYYETTDRLMGRLIQRKGLPEQFSVYNQVGSFMQNLTYERVLRDFAIFGEPADVCDRMLRLRDELKLDEFIAWVNIGGLEHEQICASMKLITEQVMPRLSR